MNLSPFLTAWGLFKDRWPIYMSLAILWLGGGILGTAIRMFTGTSGTPLIWICSTIGNVLSVFVAAILIRTGLDRARETQRPLMDAAKEIPWGLVAIAAISNTLFQTAFVAIRLELGPNLWALSNLALTLLGPILCCLVLPITIDRRAHLLIALRDGLQSSLSNLGIFIFEFGKLYGAVLLPTLCVKMLFLRPPGPKDNYATHLMSNYTTLGIIAFAGLFVVPMYYLLSVVLYVRSGKQQ